MISLQDSKIEWLGKIPKHWFVAKLKNQCQIIPSNVDKKSHDNETEVRLCNYLDVYNNESIDDSIEYMVATANEHELKKFQLFEGDVLITKDSEDPYDIAVPALVVKTQPKLLCGYHLSIIRSANQNFCGPYIFWALRDASIASQLHREATGITRWAIANRHVKNSIIPLPPETEQKAIAAYLDKTCAAIDKAIEAKQNQLGVLDALRKSIIHKAVTRGLDDSVELKDSGVEWLGRIPSTWNSQRIKDVAKLSPSFSVGKPTMTDLCTVMPMEAVSESGEISTDQLQKFNSISGGLTNFEVGDIIFAKITPCMENGKGAYIIALPTKYAFGSTEFHVLRPSDKVDGKFLYYYTFNSVYRKYAEKNMTGATGQKRVSSNFLKYTRIYLPDVMTQRNIADYLDEKCSELTELQATIVTQISTLKQYRKSLIHECVTGKRRITEEGVHNQL